MGAGSAGAPAVRGVAQRARIVAVKQEAPQDAEDDAKGTGALVCVECVCERGVCGWCVGEV